MRTNAELRKEIALQFERSFTADTVAAIVQMMQTYARERDAEWTRTVFEITDKVFTPAEAAKWLEHDRVQRARLVAAAAPRRTPPNW